MTLRSSTGRQPTLTPQRLDQAADLGRGLMSGLPGSGLLIVDAELRILRIFGDAHLDPALVGRRVPDVIPAAAWAVLESRYLSALGGLAQSFEYDALGDRGVHAVRLAPLRDDGAVVGVIALSEDITERAGPAPQAAGQWLEHSVLDALEEGVVAVDLDGRVLRANVAAGILLGIELASNGDRPLWREAFVGDGSNWGVCATVMASGRPARNVEIAFRRPDGTTISLSSDYRPLLDEDGATRGLVQSFRNVTERAREHSGLVATQERLREAHEVARLSSWEWRPETGEVLVFHALARERISAGARATLDDLLAETEPAERQDVRDVLAAMVRGDRDQSVRRSYRTYATGSAWLETRMHALRDDRGQLLCVRGTSQDVTEQEVARRETASARDFVQATLDSLATDIAVLDEAGVVVMTNRAAIDFGDADTVRPILGESYLAACDAAVDDRSAGPAAAGVRTIISGAEAEFSLEYPLHGAAPERWLELRASRFDGPGEARVVIAQEDVTERHAAESQVGTQAALLDAVDVAVIATDLKGRITQWNRGAEGLHGWTSAEAVGHVAVDLISPPGVPATREFAATLGREGRHEGEIVVLRKDGSAFPAYARGRVLVDDDGRPSGRIAVLVDTSERVAAQRALVASRDYMRAIANSMGEGLFTLDPAGRLIYMNDAAERLLGWSLDELRGKVMHDITHTQCADGSELSSEACPILQAGRERRVVHVESDLFLLRDGRRLPVAYTASPFETDDGVEGCVVVFDDVSDRKAREERLTLEASRLAWITRIRDALAEDRFLLHAQPIVDLRDGEVVQHELLLRMREPSGEIVGPSAYLEVAEQYGLIGDIDRWVVRHGIEIAATGMPVQINLSAHSVGDPDMLAHIELCIEEAGAAPEDIVFEVTETAILDDADAARRFAERLQTLGCKLALDDFGTGYGGFTYLKQVPVDCLKIDMEFVRDLATVPASRHVVDAVVALARDFELQTVAEGIEDAETLDILRDLGVGFGQGYHIARPAPLPDTAPKFPDGGISHE